VIVDLKPSSLVILKALKELNPSGEPIPFRTLSDNTHLSYNTIRRHLHMLDNLEVIEMYRSEGEAFKVRLRPIAFLSIAFEQQYGERYAYLANLA